MSLSILLCETHQQYHSLIKKSQSVLFPPLFKLCKGGLYKYKVVAGIILCRCYDNKHRQLKRSLIDHPEFDSNVFTMVGIKKGCWKQKEESKKGHSAMT